MPVRVDFVKVFQSVQIIVDEFKKAQADGKWTVDEIVTLVNEALRQLEKNDVNTGDVAELVQSILPIVAFILKRAK